MIMASCFEIVMSLSALRSAWNVTVVITYMWTAEKFSFCTTACFKVYKVSPLTILSRVARLSQGGEGPCEILAMCDYFQLNDLISKKNSSALFF